MQIRYTLKIGRNQLLSIIILLPLATRLLARILEIRQQQFLPLIKIVHLSICSIDSCHCKLLVMFTFPNYILITSFCQLL